MYKICQTFINLEGQLLVKEHLFMLGRFKINAAYFVWRNSTLYLGSCYRLAGWWI